MNTVNTPKMKSILSLTNYFSTLPSPNNIFGIFFIKQNMMTRRMYPPESVNMEGKISKKEYEETKTKV